MFRAEAEREHHLKFFCQTKSSYKKMREYKTENIIRIVFSVKFWLIFMLAVSPAFAQKLPNEIRGYKIYRAKVSVKNESDKSLKSAENAAEAVVKVGEPDIIDVSLTGVTLELPVDIDSLDQSGTIDFLTFKDFRVNGLKVDIEEYREAFDIKKHEPIILPKPVKIFVGTGQTLRGALKEFRNSKNEWTVTGTVFVFGRFKKAFIKFKRVVPVQVNIKVKNPLNT